MTGSEAQPAEIAAGSAPSPGPGDPRSELRRRAALGLTIAASFCLLGFLVLRAGAADGFRFYDTIHLGHPQARPGNAPTDLVPESGPGYDGQFYFYVAEDLFLRDPRTVPSLDNSQRYRRIAYPFLSWLFSFGGGPSLPLVMVLVNLTACTVTVVICAVASYRARAPTWLAFTVAAFPGMWIPLLFDLTEPTQAALLSAAAVTDSAALFFLASMAKETSAIFQAGALGLSLLGRDWLKAAKHAAGLFAYAGWGLATWFGVHTLDKGFNAGLFEPPFAPFTALWTDGIAADIVLLPALVVCLACVVRGLVIRDRLALGAAGYSLIVLFAGYLTWHDPLGYYRLLAAPAAVTFISWTARRDWLGASVIAAMFASGLLSLPVALVVSG